MKAFNEDRLAQSAGARGNGHAPFVAVSRGDKKLSTLLPTDRVHEIEVGHITPDPNQPRKAFDPSAISEMARSLAADGQLQPIVVRWSGDLERWVIVAGERRYRGALEAGMESLLCLVEEGDLSESDVLIKQLVENCLRADLRPVEQAQAFRTLMDAKGWTGKELAERLNVAASAVTQALSLLELPEDVRGKVAGGELSPSAAYEVAKLESPQEQREVAESIVANKLSRREAREAVKERRGRKGKEAEAEKPEPKPEVFTFKTPKKWTVTVSPTKKKVTERDVLAELRAFLDERERASQAGEAA